MLVSTNMPINDRPPESVSRALPSDAPCRRRSARRLTVKPSGQGPGSCGGRISPDGESSPRGPFRLTANDAPRAREHQRLRLEVYLPRPPSRRLPREGVAMAAPLLRIGPPGPIARPRGIGKVKAENRLDLAERRPATPVQGARREDGGRGARTCPRAAASRMSWSRVAVMHRTPNSSYLLASVCLHRS